MVYREINNVNIAINPNASNEVFFEKHFLDDNKIDNKTLAPADICNIIAQNKYLPLFLTWEIIDKCNFKCPFCYIVGHSSNKLVRFSDTKNHLQDFIDKGLLYITLTGGEVFTHPDFKDIYLFLKQSGVLVEIFSNGYLIDEKIIELFKEYPPYKIEISIYGVNQKSFERATNTKNDYKIVLDNIMKLKDNNINVFCKTPLNLITQNEFQDILKWCKKNTIPFYYSTDIYDAYDGKKLDTFSADYNTMIKYEVLKIKEMDEKYPNTFDLYETPNKKKCFKCSVKNYGAHINSNFELLPCSAYINKDLMFNILEQGVVNSISELRGYVEKFIDTEILGCNACEASSICNICPPKSTTIYKNKKIIGYEVPNGYCDFQKKKFNSIIKMLNE